MIMIIVDTILLKTSARPNQPIVIKRARGLRNIPINPIPKAMYIKTILPVIRNRIIKPVEITRQVSEALPFSIMHETSLK